MLHNQFIGRKAQLKKLHEKLETAMQKHCQVMVVSGGAGTGKSQLAQEFARQAQDKYGTILVAQGSCSAHIGTVAAYQIFIDVIAQLTGNVDAKLAEGGLSKKGANRLKDAMSISIKTLIEYGPDLIGTFIPVGALISRGVLHIAQEAGVLSKLDVLKEKEAAPGGVEKEKLMEQYTEMLRSLSSQYPLLLILDDLQWADSSSLSLLLHFLKKLENAPIMVLGLARPAYGRDGESESATNWETAIAEMTQEFGKIEIDLEKVQQDEGKTFVSEYLNACPNKFPPQFHEEIHKKTAGHPLFLSELLRGLEGEKKIWQDGDGYWNCDPNMDWTMLPSRIEGAIVERVGQIDEELRELLAIASVEGMNFSVPILAALYNRSEYDVLKLLSRKLEKQYSMVHEGAIREVDGKWLCQYSFNSAMFQQFIYDELSRRERMILHGNIAERLEGFYGEYKDMIANELALHYNLAGNAVQACRNYYTAGLRSLKVGAYTEAITLFQAALDRLDKLPNNEQDNQLKINVHIQYSNVLRMVKGWQSEDVLTASTQARDMFRKIGATPQIGPFLFNLWASYLVQMDLVHASETALENIKLGEDINSDEIRIQGHVAMGNTEYWRGNFEICLEHMQNAKILLREELVPLIAERYGQDMRLFVLTFRAFSGWIMGETTQADQDIQEIMDIAEQSKQQFALALAYQAVSWHHFHQQDIQRTESASNRLIEISRAAHLPFYDGIGTLFLGWAQAARGDAHSLTTLDHGLGLVGGDRSLMYSLFALFRSLAHRNLGNPKQAIRELEEAVTFIQSFGASSSDAYLSEMYRCLGEWTAESGQSSRAKEYFDQALSIAQEQKAKMFAERVEQSMKKFN